MNRIRANVNVPLPLLLLLLLAFFIRLPVRGALVFDFRVTDRPLATGADGREITPLSAENLKLIPEGGIDGGALQCDQGMLVYPGAVVPADRGTVEAWVTPLESGMGNGFYFFVGDPDEWGPEGMPRLWFWESRPRFDVDPGPRLIAERLPADSVWRPGVWMHLAATYDRSGMVELYVNGRLLTRKSVTPWTPVPRRGVSIGVSRNLGGNGYDHGNALISSVRIHDEVLSADTIRRSFEAVKMAQLAVSAAEHTVLLSPDEPVKLLFSNRGSAIADTVVSWKYPVSGRTGTLPLKLAPGESRPVTLPGVGGADAAGNARLELAWKEGIGGGTQRNEQVPFFLPPALPEPVREEPVWRLVREIDCYAEAPAAEVGEGRTIRSGGLAYRETGMKSHDRFAYTVKLSGKRRLVRVTATFPDDCKREIMLSYTVPEWHPIRMYGPEQQVLGSGILTGGEYPVTGRAVSCEYRFFVPDENLGLIVESYAADQPAAVCSLRIEEAPAGSRLGPALLQEAVAGAKLHRETGLYWEDPVITQCFDYAGVDYAGFDGAFTHALDYFAMTGQTMLVFPAVWYNGPLYDSRTELGCWPNGMRFLPPEYPRLMAKRCSERGIGFLPTFNMWKLPSLAPLIGSPDEVIAGQPKLNTVTRGGKVLISTNWQNPPHLNALRPEVQQAVLGLVDEMNAMCADQPAYRGIGFALWCGVPMQLGLDLTVSYDDWTMQEFAKFLGEELPGKPGDRTRFRERSRWILRDPARKAAFLRWRSDRICSFYEAVADRIQAAKPDAELRLMILYPVPGREGGDTAAKVLEQGLILDRLEKHPAIRLDRMVNQTDARQQEKYPQNGEVVHHLLEPSPEFQRPFLNRKISATIHQQYFESHGVLTRPRDPKLKMPAPWTREALGRCTQPVPYGEYFNGYFAMCLALFDAQELNIGGFTLGLHGQERPAAEWTRRYRTLPRVRFSEVTRQDGVILRRAEAEGSDWYYLVNASPRPVTLRLRSGGAELRSPVDNAPFVAGERTISPCGLEVWRTAPGKSGSVLEVVR